LARVFAALTGDFVALAGDFVVLAGDFVAFVGDALLAEAAAADDRTVRRLFWLLVFAVITWCLTRATGWCLDTLLINQTQAMCSLPMIMKQDQVCEMHKS
jgi:hypothetical protein